MMLQGKMIILQKPYPDRGNKLCNIEDDDEISDKSKVTVELIPTQIGSSKSGNTFSTISHTTNQSESHIEFYSVYPVIVTVISSSALTIQIQLVINNLFLSRYIIIININ